MLFVINKEYILLQMLLKKYTAYNIQLIMEIESAIKWLHHVD